MNEPDAGDAGFRLWVLVVASGFVVAILAVAFHMGLDAALAVRERLTAWAHPLGAMGAVVPIAVCAVAVAIAVWTTGRFAPQAAGSGIQHVEGVLRGTLPLWPLSVVWVKFVAGILGIGGGLVLGREGPTVQMGSSVAEHLGSRFGLGSAARRTLLAIGAGAGLTGAFNAPLAGTLFVVEELGCSFRPAIYVGTLLASVVTDQGVRWSLGGMAELPIAAGPPLSALAPAGLVGVLGGVLGVVFNAALLATLGLVERARRHVPAWTLGAAMGAALGGVAWYVPALPGGGVLFAASMLDGRVPPTDAGWLLPLCVVLTIGSYAVGAPGGIFAPSLVIGGALGLVVHGAWLALAPSSPVAMSTVATAGMAALFAGIVRSPLTGAVLLIEMTGSYALLLPLVVASLTAYGVANGMGSKPIYASLLDRELGRRMLGTKATGYVAGSRRTARASDTIHQP